MYKIGDKVEYLNNVWEVCDCEIENVEIYNEKTGVNIYVPIEDVKPYRTAHEKLIELGFKVIEDNEGWIVYELKDEEYVIRFCKGSKRVVVYYGYEDDPNYHLFDRKLKTYGLTKPIEVELAHIIVQYLEELKGE